MPRPSHPPWHDHSNYAFNCARFAECYCCCCYWEYTALVKKWISGNFDGFTHCNPSLPPGMPFARFTSGKTTAGVYTPDSWTGLHWVGLQSEFSTRFLPVWSWSLNSDSVTLITVIFFQLALSMWYDVAIFWDIAPSTPYVNRRFGGTYHLHLQGRKSAEQETSMQQVAGQNFLPWRWRWCSPTKRRFTYGLHGNIHNYRCMMWWLHICSSDLPLHLNARNRGIEAEMTGSSVHVSLQRSTDCAAFPIWNEGLRHRKLSLLRINRNHPD
jgi:hypothetical protein